MHIPIYKKKRASDVLVLVSPPPEVKKIPPCWFKASLIDHEYFTEADRFVVDPLKAKYSKY